MEPDRLLSAWLRKRRIRELDFFLLSAAEQQEGRRAAERSGILIPRTEYGYLYHGTSSQRAGRIRQEGLRPDQRSVWTDGQFTLHKRGRVFFCDTITKAIFYARAVSERSPAILRVAEADLADAKEDGKDCGGSFFVEPPVPAEAVEIWTPKGWERLAPEITPEETAENDTPSP